MRRPSRPHGTAFRHPDSTGRLSLAHGFTMTRAESQAPPNTARCASVARTVVLGALPARRSPARDRAVPWRSRNLKSKTAGRHLLPMGRSFRFHGTGSCQGGDAEQVSLGVLTRVRRTSDAAAPCRLARPVAAGNAAIERSTARRLHSLPLIDAEPLARTASAFARRRSQSILGDVLEPAATRRCRHWLLGVRHETWRPHSSPHCGLPRGRVGR